MQPTDTQSAERAVEAAPREVGVLADADARLTRISGEQAELSERADAIHAEFGTT